MSLKQRLASGDPVLGTFLKTPHPHIVEVLATSGLDCLCVDAEHAPFDRQAIDLCVMAARAGGLPAVVRPPTAAADHVLNALDCGADGILAPHIRDADAARALVRAVRFGPNGRGYAGSPRSAGYGRAVMADHLVGSNAAAVAIAQIEDVDALDHVAEIAAVEGLDAVFIGRADLTVSLGCSTQDDPRVEAAVAHVVATCLAAGRRVGMFLARPGDADAWRRRGATLFLLSSDHAMMRAGARRLREDAGF